MTGVSIELCRDSTYIVHKLVSYIIPNISIFEFLFVDLNLTHFPILNREELMVKKFRELEEEGVRS